MSDKDEALEIAADLIAAKTDDCDTLLDPAAAMLRSQHARIKELEDHLAERGASIAFQNHMIQKYVARIAELEAVARVALKELVRANQSLMDEWLEADADTDAAINSLRKTLGEA